MPNYWCWIHQRPRSQCPPYDGTCSLIMQMADELQEDRKNRPPIIGAWMKGGTRLVDRQMGHTRSFETGLHRYREARRAGEQPDSTTVEGVERAQKRVESHARARRKLEKAGIEVA